MTEDRCGRRLVSLMQPTLAHAVENENQIMKTTAIAGWGRNGRLLGKPTCGGKQDKMMKTTAIAGWGRNVRLLGKV
ncbi:hypothetical protein CEXT_428731 [Caerostris extrusa]|uniref:Uncharacterized protein n=1 Tax=Caerostris extrusa TaxID=172846 RepID=A0AAV4MYH0_CAEEX|nr:hypothetical protein CEXT_428731 [Caerostris extrusa]